MNTITSTKCSLMLLVSTVLAGCGTGGTGGGSGDNPSGITDQGGSVNAQAHGSPDIYNPDAYDAVAGSDDAGVYVLIQRGSMNYSLPDEVPSNPTLQLETLVSRRRVIELKSDPGGQLRVVELCTGQDFGALTEAASFAKVPGEVGRFTAHYTSHVDLMPADSAVHPSPLRFAAPYSGAGIGNAVTDVDIDAQFDLKRIGSIGSGVGVAPLTYTMSGATHTIQSACVTQAHEQWHGTYIDAKAPNEYHTVFDYVAAFAPDGGTKLFMRMQSGDAIAVGVGPIGTGTFAEFALSLNSPYGTMFYDDQTLQTHGETGVVAQTMIANDTWDLEFTGQAINDGSAKFESGSVNVTYQLKWSFK